MWTLRFIGLVYFISASWCLINKDQTLEYLGFELKSELANLEYLTVYGGIQFGIAGAMLLSSCKEKYVQAALYFSLIFSTILALFRLLGLVYYSMPQTAYILVFVESLIVASLLYAYYSNKHLE